MTVRKGDPFESELGGLPFVAPAAAATPDAPVSPAFKDLATSKPYEVNDPTPRVKAFKETTDGPSVGTFVMDRVDGIVEGELLLLFVVNGNDQNTDTDSWSTPSGWTKEVFQGTSTSDVFAAVYWRIADGTEPATVSITDSDGSIFSWVGWYLRVEGADTSDPINVSGSEVKPADQTPTFTGVTTTAPYTLLFHLFGTDGSDRRPHIQTVGGWPSGRYGIPNGQELSRPTAGATISGVTGSWISRKPMV